MPPFAGFWGKLLLLRASLEAERYWLTFMVLAVGLLTLYAMARIWAELFWKSHPDGDDAITAHLPATVWGPLIALTAILTYVGMRAAPFIDAGLRVAAGIVDPAAYVAAVLGAPR